MRNELPGVEEIDRTTLNSWEDPDFRSAVEVTGRTKVIMTGLWTEVCVAFPTLDMLREGYEVYPVSDAIGGISHDAHERAMQRMIQAGARPVTAISLVAELQRDWGRAAARDPALVFPQARSDPLLIVRPSTGSRRVSPGRAAVGVLRSAGWPPRCARKEN